MNVTVTLWYVVGCEECAAEIERVTRAAVRDIQVTKLTMGSGHRHNHPVEEPAQLPRATPSAVELEAAGQQVIPGTLEAAADGPVLYGPEVLA